MPRTRFSWKPALTGVLAAAFAAALPGAAGAQTTKNAVIVSSASVVGETISCGCKKKDLGGIARKATVVAETRAQNPTMLLVDAGDFGSASEFKPWMRTEFVWKTMKDLQYDAVTPGPNEMIRGVDALKELLATAPGIHVVSANVTDKSGNLLWPEYALVEKGGVTYGITGATEKAYYSYNLTRGMVEKDDFEFQDITKSLQRVIPQIRSQCDVVVVLLHTGSSDADRVAENLQGADVVVVGHSPDSKFLPERTGETLLIKAGSRGQYVSVLDLTLDPDKGVVEYNGESQPMGDAVVEDPQYKAMVDAFNAKYDGMKEAAGEGDKAEMK